MIVRFSTIPIAGLVSAEFLSLLGNQVAAVAIPLLVLQYTQSPLVTGIAGSANIIPIVLAAFLGGKAIDRFGAWSISLTADLLSCFSVLALPLAFIYFGEVSAALIFALVFAGALFDPTGIAARQTLVPALARLAGKPLERVNALRGGLENGADFIGPIIGAALVVYIGAINTFFVNSASFLLCAAMFALAVPRKRVRPREFFNSDLLSGARFIFQDSQLRALAVTGMVASFVILPFLGLLLPVLATRVFNNPALLGISLSAFGVSATAGALSFSKLSRIYSRSLIYYGGLLLTAFAILLCGLVTTEYGVLLSTALAGLLLGAGNPLEQTILQEETPKKLAGQVFTSLGAIRFAAGPLGLIAAGVSTEITSVNLVLILGGCLLAAAALTGRYIAPLREKNRYGAKGT
jgi:MFS family permease